MSGKPSKEEQSLTEALNELGAALDPVISLLDHLDGARFWIKDVEGRFRWVNTAVVVSRGLRSRAEIIGMQDADFFDAATAGLFRLDDLYVMTGHSIRGRSEELVINHVSHWYATSKVPLRNRRGRIVGTAGLSTPIHRPERGTGEASPLGLAVQHISTHFHQPIKNTTLAKICGMSLGNFQRLFREHYRCSPHTYIREFRVRLTCRVLVKTDHSLARIADEHGFTDQSHFTKEFRRMMNETPRSYRIRLRK